MTQSDIDRTACQMVRVFGLRAQGEAAALCAKIAARGDRAGLENWTEIRRRICAIQLVHGDCDDESEHPPGPSRPNTRGMIHAVT